MTATVDAVRALADLPEVGDVDKPKLVFFFDEAHLLFNDAPKALLEKVTQVVRLIRSKGVGVYFVTQNPLDVPDTVLAQLGNRIQHALRAFTPRDAKALKQAAETFRFTPFFHALLDNGIYVAPSPFETWFVSDALTDADFELIEAALKPAAQAAAAARPAH